MISCITNWAICYRPQKTLLKNFLKRSSSSSLFALGFLTWTVFEKRSWGVLLLTIFVFRSIMSPSSRGISYLLSKLLSSFPIYSVVVSSRGFKCTMTRVWKFVVSYIFNHLYTDAFLLFMLFILFSISLFLSSSSAGSKAIFSANELRFFSH